MSDTSLTSLGKSSCWTDPKSLIPMGRPARAGKSVLRLPRESDGGGKLSFTSTPGHRATSYLTAHLTGTLRLQERQAGLVVFYR